MTTALKRATLGVAAFALCAKGFGFLREMVIAYYFGTSLSYDLYLIAVSIPLALGTLVSTSTTAWFVPAYNYSQSELGEKAGRIAIWGDFNLLFVIGLCVVTLLVLLARPLIALIAPGLSALEAAQSARYLRIGSIALLIIVVRTFFHAIANAEKRFFIPASSLIFFNLTIIAVLLLFGDRFGIWALLFGMMAGEGVRLIVTSVPFYQSGLGKYFRFVFSIKLSQRFARAALLIILIEAVAQCFAIVDRYFASYMADGTVAALNYAYLVMTMPIMVIAYSLSTTLLPYLTESIVEENRSQSTTLFVRGTIVSVYIGLPVSVILWLFTDPIVRVLFARGAFSTASVASTAELLRLFSLSIVGQFMIWVCSRGYYATRRYGLLALIFIGFFAVKVVVVNVLVGSMGRLALPLASAVAYSFGAALLLALKPGQIGSLPWGRLLFLAVRLILAGGVMALSGWYVNRLPIASQTGLWPTAAVSGSAIILLLLLYFGLCYLLGVEPLNIIRTIFNRRERAA